MHGSIFAEFAHFSTMNVPTLCSVLVLEEAVVPETRRLIMELLAMYRSGQAGQKLSTG